MTDPTDEFAHEYTALRQAPDGGLKWVHSIGSWVREFTDPATELYTIKASYHSTLMHHVPQFARGKYRPADLPPEYLPSVTWDVDRDGFVLCTGITMQAKKCRRQAVNRSGYCEGHGGALHPWDKVAWTAKTDQRQAAKDMAVRTHNVRESRDPDRVDKLTRWQQLELGIISVEDLDDEELARGQCRGANGRFVGAPPRNVPKALHDKMMSHLLSRAQQKFREGLLGSIDALTEIAAGDAFEPADRIKAASMVIDRVMGKTPEVLLSATTQAPWEQIFEGIAGGSRAEYRASIGKATADDLLMLQSGTVIDVTAEEHVKDARVREAVLNPGQVPAATARDVAIAEVYHDTEPVNPRPDLPPDDPGQRDAWERQEAARQLAELKQVDDPATHAQRVAALKDRISAGRVRRYVARNNGLTTTTNLPYDTEMYVLYEATEEFEKMYQLRFIAPDKAKVPASVKAKETKRRRQDRG